MSVNTWWSSDPNERYWLELSDREDTGADLRAPLTDGSGKDNWRYSLFRLAAPGDVVFHYHTPRDAIVAVSEIAGHPVDEKIVWAARGTVARSKGTVPHRREGYRIPLRGFNELAKPLTLERLRQERELLAEVVATAARKFGKPLYFPFEIGGRPVRPLQGYAFKLPAEFVTRLLDPDVVAPPLLDDTGVTHSSVRPRPQRSGQSYSASPEHRRVVEQCAMEHAATYFKRKRYSIKDVSLTHSYDLQVERGNEVLHVEVKGSSGKHGAVLLTRNEVDMAKAHPERAVLYVVHSITVVKGNAGLVASGGKAVVYRPWDIKGGVLEPTAFRYELPKLNKRQPKG